MERAVHTHFAEAKELSLRIIDALEAHGGPEGDAGVTLTAFAIVIVAILDQVAEQDADASQRMQERFGELIFTIQGLNKAANASDAA